MKLEIEIRNTENVSRISDSQRLQIVEILEALVSSGGLTGVKGGQTIIHFDHQGIFKSIQLSYYPWVKRSVDSEPQKRYNSTKYP